MHLKCMDKKLFVMIFKELVVNSSRYRLTSKQDDVESAYIFFKYRHFSPEKKKNQEVMNISMFRIIPITDRIY